LLAESAVIILYGEALRARYAQRRMAFFAAITARKSGTVRTEAKVSSYTGDTTVN